MRSGRALLAFVLGVMVASGCGGNRVPEKALRGAAKEPAWVSFDEGMALAAKEKKQVVIDFYASWCRWCKVMDQETFSDPEVKKYLAENFVTIRMDAENKTQQLSYKGTAYTPFELSHTFGVKAFPSIAYLDREGKLITVVPGFLPAKTFLLLLQYMHQECYKQRMTFDEFMKRKGNSDSTKSL